MILAYTLIALLVIWNLYQQERINILKDNSLKHKTRIQDLKNNFNFLLTSIKSFTNK